MKYYNYTKITGAPTTPSTTVEPEFSHLFWEIDASAGKLLAVLDDDPSYVSSTVDKGITWAHEVRASAGSLFMEAYHDRANEKIYLIQEQGIANGETYEVDYSVWGTITITNHNGDTNSIVGGRVSDIFVRDGNLEVIICNAAQVDARRYNNPWASIDINGDNISTIGRVVIIGTTAYFWGDNQGANTIGMYSFDGATVDTLDTIAATSDSTKIAGRNMAYDGDDTIYFIALDDGTGDVYLYTYAITADTITKRGKAGFFLMNDRDTATGIKEKAWDSAVNGHGVYQLHDVIKFQLFKIAKPNLTAGTAIYCVTDNFLWAVGGGTSEIWEYEDQLSLIQTLLIDHQVEEASHAYFTQIKDAIPIEKDLLIRFYHAYTTAGSTSEEIIFEGIVSNFNESPRQSVWCLSHAKREIKNEKPSGDYTKDSDGLISQLIIDYCNYITAGTLTDGADLGTITLGGNQSLETLWDDCAEFETWIWYLTPTGKLYFNNGTVDSTINYSQSNGLVYVRPSHIHEEFNKIKVRGTYVAGVQVEGDWQEDIASQQRIGINDKIIDITFLNTTALCNTAGANLLAMLAKDPRRVTFTIRDTTAGYIQVGETITFEYNNEGIVISSDQYLIRSAVIDKFGLITYTIADELT